MVSYSGAQLLLFHAEKSQCCVLGKKNKLSGRLIWKPNIRSLNDIVDYFTTMSPCHYVFTSHNFIYT